MLPCVDMAAENESRALLDDGLGQRRRAEMLGVRLERTIDVASRYARRRVCDEDIETMGNLREPPLQRVRLALERPGIGDDRNPGRPVELYAAYLCSGIAEEMDVRRELVLPVDPMILEEYVCNRVEVVVSGDDDKLYVGIR